MVHTNLKIRVIPTILFYNYHIVKSRNFGDYRTVGNLEQTVDVYRRRKVDELVIQDIGASKTHGGLNIKVLEIMSKQCLMPITYGGGINTLEDIEKCLFVGCDKVIINTIALKEPEFVKKAAKQFGKQCIVVAIDYIKNAANKHELFSHAGVDFNKMEVMDFIKEVVDLGAGEILLTSIEKDGWMDGYDLDFIEDITQKISVPVLANGGCGNPQHMLEAIEKGASAVCAGSLFLYSQYGYMDCKQYLKSNNVITRNQ